MIKKEHEEMESSKEHQRKKAADLKREKTSRAAERDRLETELAMARAKLREMGDKEQKLAEEQRNSQTRANAAAQKQKRMSEQLQSVVDAHKGLSFGH